MNTVEVQGVSFDCFNGTPKTVDLLLELDYNSFGDVVRVVKGGITGFESFCVSQVKQDELFRKGWWANEGSTDAYPSLYIHGLQMKEAFEKLEILESEKR
jgi:hypothetical protein